MELPEIAALNEGMGRCEGWRAEAREALQAKPTLEQLQHLAGEAERLPVIMQEMGSIQSLLDKATDWLQKATPPPGQELPLRIARQLLHSGERLGVEMPQVCTFFAGCSGCVCGGDVATQRA